MGCVTATAKRRRRQAKNRYNHLAKMGRPIYSKKSASKSDARLRRLVQAEHERRQRKGASAKGKN